MIVHDLAMILMKVLEAKRGEMERLLAYLVQAPDSDILLNKLIMNLMVYE